MGARGWVVLGLVGGASIATAGEHTLEPARLTLSVPDGWQVLSERAGDFLHYESSEDSEPRTIDLAFERSAGMTCRTWRASGGKKQFPAYWPKRARTHLYVVRGDGRLRASGCLADTPSGALVAHLEVTTENPSYKPSAIEVALLRDTLAAALAGAVAPVTASAGPASRVSSTTSGEPAVPAVAAPALDPAAIKGGTHVTIPALELAVKLPKTGHWLVAPRGEAKLERDPSLGPALSATLFPLRARSCAEWRVDTSASDRVTYESAPAFLPMSVKTGAFLSTQAGATQISACVEGRAGTLGIAIELAALGDTDTPVVRALLDALAVAASKHKAPWSSAPAVIDGGTLASTLVGKVQLPRGAQWRVGDATLERADKGRYFSVSAMSRPTSCALTGTSEHPFLPAGVAGMVVTRPSGATVIRACVQTTRTIELTIAYDGAIAPADHGLLRATVDAFARMRAK